MSRDKFAHFLTRTQGEAPLKAPLEKERYNFGEFLEEWSFRHGWDVQKTVGEDIDLSRSIANYFISSSHNTYLVGNQVTSDASADAYRKVCHSGL